MLDKPILVNERNAVKIIAAIAEAEGKATARIISAEGVMDALEVIEKRLGIPKARMTGIRVEVDINAQVFPKSYKYIPESTQFEAIRTSSGWKITNIFRGKTHGPTNRYILHLTDDAKESIIECLEHFG